MTQRRLTPTALVASCLALYGCNAKILEFMELDGGSAPNGNSNGYPYGGEPTQADAASPDASPSPPSTASDGGQGDESSAAQAPMFTSGTLIALATGQSSPIALAVDSTSVYWGNYDNDSPSGTIAKVSIDGGAVTTLATGQSGPGGIAVDSTNVYWAAAGLWKMPIGGGTPTLLSSSFTNDTIALGPSNVCGTGDDDAPMTVPIGGGSTLTLGPGTGQNTYGVACNATTMYWTDFTGAQALYKVALDGGTVTTLATGSIPEGLAIDAANAYWVNAGGQGPGSLMKVPLSGGAPVTLASDLSDATGLVIDATNAYAALGFSSFNGEGAIIKVPLGGGAVTTLVSGLDEPSGIAVDATSVYFSTLGGEVAGAGTIWKFTPK